MERVIGFIGVGCFALCAYLWSRNRRKINWHTIVAAVALEFIFAAVIFMTPGSRSVFVGVSNAFQAVIESTREGIVFVLGDLGCGESKNGFILAFQSLPFIIIFSALTALLYYLRIIPWLIRLIAHFVRKVFGTSAAESLCAASNIFVGIESVTTIRPYLDKLTRSELFLIVTVGMATVASSVLALYVALLGKVFPTIAGHLVSASVLSIPAAVLVAKLMEPETGKPVTGDLKTCKIEINPEARGVIGSILSGATDGGKLAMGVAVSLIAFIGILGICRMTLDKLSGGAVTVEMLLGGIFYPFTYLLGIAPADVPHVAELLGTRLVFTEVPAYIRLSQLIGEGLSSRSAVIASYALCGFSHVASLGIFIGGIAALAPKRAPELASFGFKALFASTLATLITGAVAGIFCGSSMLL